MEKSFTNTLTTEEIKLGIWTYVKKRFIIFQGFIALLIIDAATIIWSIFDGTILDRSILMFLGISLVFIILLIWLLHFSYTVLFKQFGSTKQATYIIHDAMLEIINNDGEKTTHPWQRMIACIEKKDIYVLLLNRQQFVILAKNAVGDTIQIIKEKLAEGK